MVYLIGRVRHGIEPALLSISVHNMLRSDVILRPGPFVVPTESAVPDGAPEWPTS